MNLVEFFFFFNRVEFRMDWANKKNGFTLTTGIIIVFTMLREGLME